MKGVRNNVCVALSPNQTQRGMAPLPWRRSVRTLCPLVTLGPFPPGWHCLLRHSPYLTAKGRALRKERQGIFERLKGQGLTPRWKGAEIEIFEGGGWMKYGV